MPVLSFLRQHSTVVGRFVLDALAPLRCVGCNTIGAIACTGCLGKVHAHIQVTNGPTPLESITSAMDFDTPLVRDLIHALKYEGIRAAADPLAQWLIPVVQTQMQPGDVLVPVPLHRRRERTRGYNQSQLLADRVGKALNLSVLQGAVRTRNTKPQVECNGDERRTNLVDAFAAQPIDARRIILVDDVTTTGSTLQEVAQAIRKTTKIPILGVAVGRG